MEPIIDVDKILSYGMDKEFREFTKQYVCKGGQTRCLLYLVKNKHLGTSNNK